MTSYTSTAQRRDRYWLVQCDQVPGAMSTVSRLDQAATHQREAIAFVTDVPAAEVDVAVRVKLPLDVETELSEVAYWREQAHESERNAAEHWRQAALRLREEGYSLRDIGHVLGISHQRVHQLVSSKAS